MPGRLLLNEARNRLAVRTGGHYWECEVRMSETNVLAMIAESIPRRLCKVCGKQIEFSRRAARDWETIEFCSAACRRAVKSSKVNSKSAGENVRARIA